MFAPLFWALTRDTLSQFRKSWLLKFFPHTIFHDWRYRLAVSINVECCAQSHGWSTGQLSSLKLIFCL
jgi:hypothetical protein